MRYTSYSPTRRPRYWTGLGQTAASPIYSEMADGSQMYRYADGSFEITFPSGEYYNEDAQGNWSWQGADGSVCTGAPTGGWSCSMADGSVYNGGDWTTSPAAATKQAATANVTAAKTAPPGAVPNQPPKKNNSTYVWLGLGALAIFLLAGKRR